MRGSTARSLLSARNILLLGAALALALALGAISAGASGRQGGGQLKNGGTLTIALAEDPDVLDPTLARTFVGRIVFMHICEKLYDLNAKLQIVPQLAAGMPRVSADKRTVTIRLRTGIKFNDGTPFNAQAAKISLDRHRTLPLSRRASELSPVSSVDAVGARTIVIHLSEPFAPLTAQLADRAGMVMSPAQLDKLGGRFGTNPVCVGPFQFVSRTAGDRIVVKKSPSYYAAKKVHLDQIVFRIINEPSAAAQALRAHDVDVVDRLGPTELPAIKSDRSLSVLAATSIGYQGITINIGNKNGLLKLPYQNTGTMLAAHKNLRQAFELAIDRRLLNRVVFQGQVQPGCGPIAPTSPWFDRSIPCNARADVARAKRLVAQSGVRSPTIRLMIGNDALAARLGEFLQAQERQAGINVELQPTEFVSSLAKADAGQYEAFAIGWSGRVDPDGNIYQFVHTKGSQNDSGYSNPRLDVILDNARHAKSERARKTLYRAAIRIIRSDRPLIYLYHTVTRDGVSKKVGGIKLFGDGLIRAQFAALK
jgi:peptide/nickel transport system substrate-binding protein